MDFRVEAQAFEAEMQRQRERAQASWKGGPRKETAAIHGKLAARHTCRFEGYETTRLDGVPVTALTRDGVEVASLTEGQEGELLLEATPFYAESGGQVGDTGRITMASGQARVLDTQRPAEGLILHRVTVEAGDLPVGEPARAEVDTGRRDAIRRNHTATHLIHAALRNVVGTHVKQAGSLVAPERLRFDYSHFAPIAEQSLADIETLVNRQVLAGLPVETETMPIEEALEHGAMALFGEKYGASVRVVRIGDFSLELCGGTHCAGTGEIGLVKLTGERGVASGTRRVEAITGEGSLARFREAQTILKALEERLAVPRELLIEEIERRFEQARSARKELERARLGDTRERLMQQAGAAPEVAGVRLMAARVDEISPREMRELADNLRQKLGSGVVVLGRAEGAKASLLVAVTEELRGRLPAGDLVRSLAKIIGGGGGGRPDLAEAGGKEPGRLDEALAAAAEAVRSRMEAEG